MDSIKSPNFHHIHADFPKCMYVCVCVSLRIFFYFVHFISLVVCAVFFLFLLSRARFIYMFKPLRLYFIRYTYIRNTYIAQCFIGHSHTHSSTFISLTLLSLSRFTSFVSVFCPPVSQYYYRILCIRMVYTWRMSILLSWCDLARLDSTPYVITFFYVHRKCFFVIHMKVSVILSQTHALCCYCSTLCHHSNDNKNIIPDSHIFLYKIHFFWLRASVRVCMCSQFHHDRMKKT